MDPFIELIGGWGDFHDKLIAEIERELARLIPSRYFVRIGSRAYIALTDDDVQGSKSVPMWLSRCRPSHSRLCANRKSVGVRSL